MPMPHEPRIRTRAFRRSADMSMTQNTMDEMVKRLRPPSRTMMGPMICTRTMAGIPGM